MKKYLLTIGKAIILLPASVLAYVVAGFIISLLLLLTSFLYNLIPFFNFSNYPTVEEFLIFYSSSGFGPIGYWAGTFYLIAIRYSQAFVFFVVSTWLFPDNKKFVFGIMLGIYVLLFAAILVVLGYKPGESLNGFENTYRTVLELVIQIAAIIGVYRYIDKNEY
jgi:hypothetical protein